MNQSSEACASSKDQGTMWNSVTVVPNKQHPNHSTICLNNETNRRLIGKRKRSSRTQTTCQNPPFGMDINHTGNRKQKHYIGNHIQKIKTKRCFLFKGKKTNKSIRADRTKPSRIIPQESQINILQTTWITDNIFRNYFELTQI